MTGSQKGLWAGNLKFVTFNSESDFVKIGSYALTLQLIGWFSAMPGEPCQCMDSGLKRKPFSKVLLSRQCPLHL